MWSIRFITLCLHCYTRQLCCFFSVFVSGHYARSSTKTASTQLVLDMRYKHLQSPQITIIRFNKIHGEHTTTVEQIRRNSATRTCRRRSTHPSVGRTRSTRIGEEITTDTHKTDAINTISADAIDTDRRIGPDRTPHRERKVIHCSFVIPFMVAARKSLH